MDKIHITDKDIETLMFIYYDTNYSLKKDKGLLFSNAFKLKKFFEQYKFKAKDRKLDDYFIFDSVEREDL